LQQIVLLLGAPPQGVVTSAGQAAALPVQNSLTSQPPTPLRQSVAAGRNGLFGQAAPVPVQRAGPSQAADAARQTVPAGTNSLSGQAFEVPVQNSGRSQGPAAARHCVVAGANGLAGQAVPTQTASSSQVPACLQTCPVLRGSSTQAAFVPEPTHVFTAQKVLGPVGQGVFGPHTG
jgi:hypothetical protein